MSTCLDRLMPTPISSGERSPRSSGRRGRGGSLSSLTQLLFHEFNLQINSPTLSSINQVSESGPVKGLRLWSRNEVVWLCLILGTGLLPRVLFIRAFPTHPISDFASLLNFSILFRDDWLAKGAAQWRLLSPGLPMLLSILLRLIPKSPETVGRWATAISTGLVPAIPYLLWKTVFQLRTRILAGMFLALWPGQILFSSVPAQDNWVILPVVGLTALAVRLIVLGQRWCPDTGGPALRDGCCNS